MRTDDSHVGETVRVCHKQATIVRANSESYVAELELGGIDQQVLLSPEYVDARVEA